MYIPLNQYYQRINTCSQIRVHHHKYLSKVCLEIKKSKHQRFMESRTNSVSSDGCFFTSTSINSKSCHSLQMEQINVYNK